MEGLLWLIAAPYVLAIVALLVACFLAYHAVEWHFSNARERDRSYDRLQHVEINLKAMRYRADESKAHEVANQCNRPHPDDNGGDEEEPAPESGGHGPQIRSGRCGGCGLVHIGLTPSKVYPEPNGGYHIMAGTPALCPRCWCKVNPTDATNVVTGGYLDEVADGVGSVATGRDNPEPGLTAEERAAIAEQGRKYVESDAPAKQPSDADAVAELERATAPNLTCDKCKATGTDNPKLVFRESHDPDGKPTGKFWCSACVDALGGPPPSE